MIMLIHGGIRCGKHKNTKMLKDYLMLSTRRIRQMSDVELAAEWNHFISSFDWEVLKQLPDWIILRWEMNHRNLKEEHMIKLCRTGRTDSSNENQANSPKNLETVDYINTISKLREANSTISELREANFILLNATAVNPCKAFKFSRNCCDTWCDDVLKDKVCEGGMCLDIHLCQWAYQLENQFKVAISRANLETSLNELNYPICPLEMYFESDEYKTCAPDRCDFKDRSCSEACKIPGVWPNRVIQGL